MFSISSLKSCREAVLALAMCVAGFAQADGPVSVANLPGGGGSVLLDTDVSEGGMAVQMSRRPKNVGSMRVQFTLPGTNILMDSPAEFAWENSEGLAGIRFQNMAPDASIRLKEWIVSQSPEADRDDPPAPCKLTDLSLGGCYLEISSPFPVSSASR